jgi:glycosyltransferase involved in cell wall biosynthesis
MCVWISMSAAGRPLTILKLIAPQRYSGAERIAVYLAEGLKKRGHRVVFACRNQPEFVAELQRRDLECLSCRISGKLNLGSFRRVLEITRRVRPDIIHTHLSTGAMWGSVVGRLLGVPVLAHVHALNSKWFFLLADRMAACSEGVKRHLVSQGIAPERVEVVYNGIELSAFEHLRPVEEVRQELGLSPDHHTVGVTAHLSPKKGQRHIIEATALLAQRRPDLRCVLIGEGAQRAELEALARSLGIADRVLFLGYRSDAADLMQALDIVVLPSVAKEGLGLALVEGGALGKPVIGSDMPGIDEVIVNGENGLLVPPGDPAALADAIESLLADPDLCRRMGEAGRLRAHQMFTLDRMVEDTEKLYYSMLVGCRPAPGG